ncbi:YitT family protein [Ancylomarina sp. 16SWW S1-10-2]|uniref:YitT family protein n=1 Tax=Ancylomarina sp. 16SWW S1-10-2 TaxID=2499681 RepID=UPI0012AE4D3B|nr:YitT family protein [Ancylomarina sp. 16SWW S1-10-2]MRT94165.1 YitT family protein [Ancylomarina sp. 16SWW S1-10-2]
MVSNVNFTEQFKSYFIIALGLFIGSVGWTGFLIPSEIVGGGVTGIATIIYFITGFKVGYSVFIINGLLLVMAMRVLGFGFGVKTIFATFVLSFFLWFLQSVITEPLVSDRFMCAIIGGIMAGASAGIILSQGGSTGGTDIIAMIINKYRNYSPGQLLLTLDLLIISSSYFLSNSIEQVVYGFVAMGVSAYCVDMVIEGSKQSVQIFIFTKKYDEMREEIIYDLSQGMTELQAKGGYSQEDVKVFVLLAKKKDAQAILKMVKIVDPDAFISMGSVMGVYGQGFDKIK